MTNQLTESTGGGGGSGGGGSGGDDGGVLPSWIWGLKPLVGFVGVLVAFASSPKAFILEYVLEYAVGLFLEGGAIVAGAFESIWVIVAESFVDAFDPLFTGGGMIAAAVSSVLSTINAVLVDVVSAAGPVAPILVMLAWVVIAIIALQIVRWLLLAVPYVGQWI